MNFIEDFPALQPPPGVKSNFIDPPSLVPSAIVVESIFLPLMILAVLTRLFVRARITKELGWDDCKIFFFSIASICPNHIVNYSDDDWDRYMFFGRCRFLKKRKKSDFIFCAH